MTGYAIPQAILDLTFENLRRCGNGRRECQVLWLSPWASPVAIDEVAHPAHSAHAGGFSVHGSWLNSFWLDMANRSKGIRVQVHTHPGAAFHSPTDDEYPIIHTPGFLSLVIPNFASGTPSLRAAYLGEIQPNGSWSEVDPASRLRIVP